MRRVLSLRASVIAVSAATLLAVSGCTFDSATVPVDVAQTPESDKADVVTVTPGSTADFGWEPVTDEQDTTLVPDPQTTDVMPDNAVHDAVDDDAKPGDGPQDGANGGAVNDAPTKDAQKDKNGPAGDERAADAKKPAPTPKKEQAAIHLDLAAERSRATSWLKSYRSSKKLPVWKDDSCLRNAAQSWSKKMAAAGKASNPKAPSCAGYVTTLVAAGTVAHVSELLDAWTGSPSHSKTLQRMDLRVMGVGLHAATDPQRGGDRLYAAVMLGQGAAPSLGSEYNSNSSFRPMAGRGRVARGMPLLDKVSLQLNQEATTIEWNVVRGRTPDRSAWQSDREVAGGLWSSTDPVQGAVQISLRNSVTRGTLATKNLSPGEYTLQIRYGGKRLANHYSIIVW